MGGDALEWTVFDGTHSTIAHTDAGRPTVGVAPFKCACCDDRSVVIGASSTQGPNIAVGLSPEDAAAFAQSILDCVATVTGKPVAGGVN